MDCQAPRGSALSLHVPPIRRAGAPRRELDDTGPGRSAHSPECELQARIGWLFGDHQTRLAGWVARPELVWMVMEGPSGTGRVLPCTLRLCPATDPGF
jgi:hypothetical protein